MLINRIQSAEEFRELDLPKNYLKNLSEHSTDELLDIIQKVVAAVLRHLKISEEEVEEFTGGHEEGWQKGLREGRQKGLQEGIQEGRQIDEELLLIKLICKKLAPEYDPEQIQYALNNTDC